MSKKNQGRLIFASFLIVSLHIILGIIESIDNPKKSKILMVLHIIWAIKELSQMCNACCSNRSYQVAFIAIIAGFLMAIVHLVYWISQAEEDGYVFLLNFGLLGAYALQTNFYLDAQIRQTDFDKVEHSKSQSILKL